MKKTIIISLAVALLAFSGGYFLGKDKSISGQNINQDANNNQAKTGAAAENNVAIQSLSGTVEAVNGNSIILKINPQDERTVEVNNQTKVYILKEKSLEEYQNEMAEYNRKIQEQNSGQAKLPNAAAAPLVFALSPEVFAKAAASLSDIKNGIIITTVAAGQDIRDAKQFKASEIFIPPAPNPANGAINRPIK